MIAQFIRLAPDRLSDQLNIDDGEEVALGNTILVNLTLVEDVYIEFKRAIHRWRNPRTGEWVTPQPHVYAAKLVIHTATRSSFLYYFAPTLEEAQAKAEADMTIIERGYL